MPESEIRATVDRDRATVTINRPETRNAMTARTFAALGSTFEEFDADDSLSVVTIRGSDGDFSAGVDVSGVPDWTDASPRCVRETFESVHDALRAVETVGLPVIAAIEGYCLGGGLELALCCDLRVASVDATIGLPEASLGLAMDLGGAQKLPGMIGEGRTKELVMTGEPVDGERAYTIGLVERAADTQVFEAAVSDLADTLAEKPTYVHALAKRQIHAVRPSTLDAAMGRAIDDAIVCYHEPETQRRVRGFLGMESTDESD